MTKKKIEKRTEFSFFEVLDVLFIFIKLLLAFKNAAGVKRCKGFVWIRDRIRSFNIPMELRKISEVNNLECSIRYRISIIFNDFAKTQEVSTLQNRYWYRYRTVMYLTTGTSLYSVCRMKFQHFLDGSSPVSYS
jgi:hypothetical protein